MHGMLLKVVILLSLLLGQFDPFNKFKCNLSCFEFVRMQRYNQKTDYYLPQETYHKEDLYIVIRMKKVQQIFFHIILCGQEFLLFIYQIRACFSGHNVLAIITAHPKSISIRNTLYCSSSHIDVTQKLLCRAIFLSRK